MAALPVSLACYSNRSVTVHNTLKSQSVGVGPESDYRLSDPTNHLVHSAGFVKSSHQ